MKFAFHATVSHLVGLILLTAPSVAAEILDQQNDVNGSATADSTSSGAQEISQTFTVGESGTLSRIEAQLSRPGFTTSGSVLLTVYNTAGGVPNSSLGTASLNWDAIPMTGFGYQSFDFSLNGVPVYINDLLAISIKSDNTFFWRSTFNTSTYAGGEAKFRVLNVPPGPWTSYSPSHDYGFKTYVNPPVGLPGDYNGDHFVSAADYTVWRNHLGEATEASLNGNGDGLHGVDLDDYTRWKTNYGATGGAGGSLARFDAVPEPGGSSLVCLIGAASVFTFRNHRRTRGK